MKTLKLLLAAIGIFFLFNTATFGQVLKLQANDFSMRFLNDDDTWDNWDDWVESDLD